MIILELAAILSCTFFAGAAIYINIVEHPARLECGTELAASVFGPSYRRAARLQATLAIMATFFGAILAVTSNNPLWYFGAALIFSVVPFTFIVIMPTNLKLLAPTRDRSAEETEALLNKWGALHAVRSLVSCIAAVIYVYIGLMG